MRRSAPDFLTVEEAATVLRIGRTAAYSMTREYLATGGASGLPCVKIAKQVRVVRALLEAMVGTAITWPIATAQPHRRVRIVVIDRAGRRETKYPPSAPCLVS